MTDDFFACPPLDYGRSFITFETLDRVNNARIQVEARCRLESAAGAVDYYLVASCKAEDTYGAGDLFLAPNYDFCCIFTEDEYQILRTHATVERGGRETGRIADRFHEVRFALTPAPAARECPDAPAIAAATLANHRLVGRTGLSLADGRRALLEYPVKTMNANPERAWWQVDTGPLLLPTLEPGAPAGIAGFDLAYVACNRPDRADFIQWRPEPVAPGAPLVPHYGSPCSLPARNRVLALD